MPEIGIELPLADFYEGVEIMPADPGLTAASAQRRSDNLTAEEMSSTDRSVILVPRAMSHRSSVSLASGDRSVTGVLAQVEILQSGQRRERCDDR